MLCETEGSAIPLFLQHWWLEAVCHGKQWDVLLLPGPGGDTVAAMPYLTGVRCGLRYVLQPQLTQYNGPWYRPGTDVADASRRLAAAVHDMRPALFQQSFAPSVTCFDGWERYDRAERVTYRIDDLSDLQRVYDGFDKSRRQRQIRRAERLLTPDRSLTPEAFADFHAAYWRSRGQQDLLSHDFIVRVVGTACRRGQGLLMGLRDGDGELQVARFVAYDDHSAYSLLSALHPLHHANGASALLFWQMMQELSDKTRAFDFEGSMDPGIALSYRLYGARPVTYSRLTRCRIPFLTRLLHIR